MSCVFGMNVHFLLTTQRMGQLCTKEHAGMPCAYVRLVHMCDMTRLCAHTWEQIGKRRTTSC